MDVMNLTSLCLLQGYSLAFILVSVSGLDSVRFTFIFEEVKPLSYNMVNFRPFSIPMDIVFQIQPPCSISIKATEILVF